MTERHEFGPQDVDDDPGLRAGQSPEGRDHQYPPMANRKEDEWPHSLESQAALFLGRSSPSERTVRFATQPSSSDTVPNTLSAKSTRATKPKRSAASQSGRDTTYPYSEKKVGKGKKTLNLKFGWYESSAKQPLEDLPADFPRESGRPGDIFTHQHTSSDCATPQIWCCMDTKGTWKVAQRYDMHPNKSDPNLSNRHLAITPKTLEPNWNVFH